MFTGVLARVPLASTTLRLDYRPRTGLLGAPVVGVVFALGWTPCIGPTLAAVLTVATTSATAGRGTFLSVAYALGLGVPFILAALSWQRMTRTFTWARRHARLIMRLGGGLLIVLGILQVSGLWRWVTSWIQTLVVNWVVPL
jgi:cytochrome c-type biogenesis protein